MAPVGRDRACSVASTGSDFDEWMESMFVDDGTGTNDFSVTQEVSLQRELSRTISAFHKNARPEGSWAVPAVDGAELTLSDDEHDSQRDCEPEPEPEAEPESGAQPEPDARESGPRFDTERLKAAAKARARPVWERSTKNGGSSMCMWCDQTFSPTCWRYHCRRCGWAVCDRCSPHRLILDTWLEYEKPHAVRHEVSETTQRVCDGCARAAHEPAAASVFYLATISRISDQTSVVSLLRTETCPGMMTVPDLGNFLRSCNGIK